MAASHFQEGHFHVEMYVWHCSCIFCINVKTAHIWHYSEDISVFSSVSTKTEKR